MWVADVSALLHDSMHTKCEDLTYFYPHNFNNFSGHVGNMVEVYQKSSTHSFVMVTQYSVP